MEYTEGIGKQPRLPGGILGWEGETELKTKRFSLVCCMFLGLFLAAMTGLARADNCDSHQVPSYEKGKKVSSSTDHHRKHGVSGDRERTPDQIQEARDTANLPVAGGSITDAEGTD